MPWNWTLWRKIFLMFSETWVKIAHECKSLVFSKWEFIMPNQLHKLFIFDKTQASKTIWQCELKFCKWHSDSCTKFKAHSSIVTWFAYTYKYRVFVIHYCSCVCVCVCGSVYTCNRGQASGFLHANVDLCQPWTSSYFRGPLDCWSHKNAFKTVLYI